MTEVEGRFRIIRSLGTGAGGETFEAEDIRDGARVAVKRLALASTNDWKKVDLFEREARLLASLQHPAIPRYRESFVVETEQGPVSYLVHDFAPGQSLRAWVESGWRADEGEIVRIGVFLLDVLAYLHALHPPVIHRDVKPANVIRSDEGRLWLVDFGAVRDTTTTMAGSSTVVGTYGYMAPEQFRGHALPTSDIYGVGATLLYLLGGKPPTEYPQEKLKVTFRGQVKVSPFLARWIGRALEPVPEERFPDAAQALAVLRGQLRLEQVGRPETTPPRRVKVLASILGVLIALMVVVGLVEKVGQYSRERRTLASTASTLSRLPARPTGPDVAEEVRVFEGRHTNIIYGMALSPDEKTLATGSDAVIKVWDVDAAKEVRSMGAHGGKIGGVYFFADNKRLLTGGGRTLKTWDYATGKELTSVDVGTVIRKVVVSSDEKAVFHAGEDGVIHVWDLEKGGETATFPFGQPIYALRGNADGTRLAAGGRDGLVKVYAVPGGRAVADWKPHTQPVNDLAFSSDGSMIASAGDDARTVVTALESNGRTHPDSEYPSRDEVWGVAFSPDGKLLTTMSKDKDVGIISLARRYKQQAISLSTFAEKALFSRDGRRLLIAGGSMVVSCRIARRGPGMVFPEARPDAVSDYPAPRDEDQRRYFDIQRLFDKWPNADTAQILAQIDDAAKANPSSPLPLLARTQLEIHRAFLSGNDYDPSKIAFARSFFVKAEALGKKPIELWTTKAFLERAAKDYPAAREALRQAFLLDEHNPVGKLSEAHLDECEGNHRAAAIAMSELIRTTKNELVLRSAYAELATLAENIGDLDLAERCHQETIKRDPKNPWSRGNYARFFVLAGEWEKAIVEARAALAMMDYPAAHHHLAYAHIELGHRALWDMNQADVALREYDEAISHNPSDAFAYYGRAAIYRAKAYDEGGAQNIAKARANLEKALALAKAPWAAAEQALKDLDALAARKR